MQTNDSFAGCLVDGDADALERARRLRGKALAASLVLEVGLIGAMLVWPLITPGVLPGRYSVTPAPPYGGRADASDARRGHPHHATEIHAVTTIELRQPPRIPARVSESLEQPELDAGIALGGSGSASGGDGIPGGGPGIPGGLGIAPPPMPPVAPPRPPSAPVKMSEGVMEAQLIQRVQPVYPDIARKMHLSGVVQLRAIIGTDGRTRQVEVVSGSPILARAAIEAVNQWRYRPTLLSGKEVEVDTLITVNFVLQ